MTPRTIVTVLLLVFVAGSIGFLVFKESANSETAVTEAVPQAPIETAQVAAQPDQLVVYYFHSTRRCRTCRNIESQARDAIEAGFPEALMSGALDWRAVNVDEGDNARLARDLDVAGSGILMAEYRGGNRTRFKPLPKVWNLVGDEPAFLEYIQSEVRDWLEAAPR
jgi:hypothetical protein